jgi:hypothetical protein
MMELTRRPHPSVLKKKKREKQRGKGERELAGLARAGLAGLGPGSAQWLALLFFFVLKPFLISVL